MTARQQTRALQSVDAEIKADPFGWARTFGSASLWSAEVDDFGRRVDAFGARVDAALALATPEPRSQGEV